MVYSFEFKKKSDLQDTYLRLRRKVPHHIPIICEGDFLNADEGREGKPLKFLVSPNISVAEFISFLRKNLRIKSSEGVFILMGGHTAVPATMGITEVYDLYKDESGFLFVAVMKENVFG